MKIGRLRFTNNLNELWQIKYFVNDVSSNKIQAREKVIESMDQEDTRSKIVAEYKKLMHERKNIFSIFLDNSDFPKKGSLKDIILYSQQTDVFGRTNLALIVLKERLKWIDDEGYPTETCPFDFKNLWEKWVGKKNAGVEESFTSIYSRKF